MSHLCKLIIIVFVVIAKAGWPIEAFPYDESDIGLAPMDERQEEFGDYTPSPSPYGDEISPESEYPYDEMEAPYSVEQYPPSYAPEYPYEDEYDYASPAPAPSPEAYYMEEMMAPEYEGAYEYDPPSEAPSETELSDGGRGSPTPAVMEFNYGGEEVGYDQTKENKSGIGRIVMGAICLVGLGGLVYRNKTNNQKPKHKVYMKLANKRQDV